MNVHVELVMIAKLGVIHLAPIMAPGKNQWKQLIKNVNYIEITDNKEEE